MKVGIVGDFHYPDRGRTIQEWIWERLSCCSLILSTGDFISQDVFKRLSTIAPFQAVKGNMDFLDLPSRKRLLVEGWSIGLFHGSGIHPRGNLEQLYEIALSMDVNIFIHGHTHRLEIQSFKDVLFLNPGSACGVWSGGGIKTSPSMILCEIEKEIEAEGIEDNGVTLREKFKIVRKE